MPFQYGFWWGYVDIGPLHKGPLHKGPLHKGPLHKGPLHKGPLHKGPLHKGPLHKGPLLYKVAHWCLSTFYTGQLPTRGFFHLRARGLLGSSAFAISQDTWNNEMLGQIITRFVNLHLHMRHFILQYIYIHVDITSNSICNDITFTYIRIDITFTCMAEKGMGTLYI